MTVTIGHTTFDRVSYDADGDVLYLHVGAPANAVDFDESPEGHHLRFDADGRLIGVTIVNAKWLLERDGKITLTVPERVEVGPDALAPALAPA
jgi:uncharacterized protein YuzE